MLGKICFCLLLVQQEFRPSSGGGGGAFKNKRAVLNVLLEGGQDDSVRRRWLPSLIDDPEFNPLDLRDLTQRGIFLLGCSTLLDDVTPGTEIIFILGTVLQQMLNSILGPLLEDSITPSAMTIRDASVMCPT